MFLNQDLSRNKMYSSRFPGRRNSLLLDLSNTGVAITSTSSPQEITLDLLELSPMEKKMRLFQYRMKGAQ